MNLKYHRYGKAKVRVLKKLKRDSLHTIKELDVQVLLAGDFESSYSDGDNRLVVATDTMKNTVNVLAFEKLEEQTERFVLDLAQHFLEKYPHVSKVTIETSERVWQRLKADGKPSPTNFLAPQKYTPVCEVHATRADTRLFLNRQAPLLLTFIGMNLRLCPRHRIGFLQPEWRANGPSR
jgi:urate oxidase